MDSRLKERLIGAAVLVALGVWLIPWLLDGSARPRESDLASLQLPAEPDAAPVRAQTIRLDQKTATESVQPQTPSIVGAPIPSTVAPPASPAEDSGAAASGEWVVQLGSFGDAANAERLASRVGAFGFKAAVSEAKSSGKVMHRVRLGPYPTRGEAEAVTSSLSAHGFVAQVVQDQ